ncbi:MAG: hypothetical protein NVS4B10_04400 [Myxococcales bacterium]
MDARLEQIVGLAWRSVPAADANTAIAEAREAAGSGGSGVGTSPHGAAGFPQEGSTRSYEVVLSPDATFDAFVRDQVPKLVYHLESIGAHPPRAEGVLICLFVGDRLHFVHAGRLVELVCKLLAIAPVELVRRYGTGERRTAMPAARAALPPPDDGGADRG